MTGNSNTRPKSVEKLGAGYLIRWNINRNDRITMTDMPAIESYDFEYNTKYQAKEISKKEIMLAIIREKYDVSDEISISLKRIGDEDKYQEHEDYVNSARLTAEQIMSNETIQ